MTKRINHSSCAFHAIAASLALCSTPLLAQEVSRAAPPSAAAAPAPVVVLPAQPPAPEPAAAPSVEAPAAAKPAVATPTATTPAIATPASGRASNAPAPARATPRARPALAARPASQPQIVASTLPVAAAAKPLGASPTPPAPAPSPLAAAPEEALPASQPEAVKPADNSTVIGLGALAALGIVGAGFLATRRRRMIVTDDAAPEIIEPIDAASTVARPSVAPPAVAAAAIVAQPAYSTADPDEPAVDNARPMTGHSVSMPDGPVPTGEARQQLIDRMVAAAPDAANPFTSVKGRRHRARLILQAREGEQQRAGQDGFDWRNHPTLRNRDEPVADRTTIDA